MAAACLLAGASSAAAGPLVHAHRGGSVIDGVPRFPENTLPAFRNAALEHQAVLEVDVKLTKDGVPVVIHDDTFDRTTPCTGPISSRTLAQLDGCRSDVLGSPGSQLPSKETKPEVPIPTLAAVLKFAKGAGARVNLEIKNLPTDNDFDATSAYADRVLDVVDQSGIPRSLVLIQSFWPPNLDVAERRGFETSFLTLQQTNSGGPEFAKSNGYEFVSPAFPVDQAYVSRAHALGLRVVPFTLDTAADIKAAAALGVDEIITDDPGLARRVLAEVEPAAAPLPPPPTAEQCRATRASRTVPPLENLLERPGAPRVFAMQFKQDARHVETYDSFRVKIECMVREYVVPRKVRGRPNVVAFNEDIGLFTIATGSRGQTARSIFADPSTSSTCTSAMTPPACAFGALAAIGTSYAPQMAAYEARFPGLTPITPGAFVATTDTLARSFMQSFSDIAKRYGVYMLGSNNQAPFRESTDPAEIEAFRDPDLPRPSSVFVATGPRVFNEVFMWGPTDVRPDGPRPLRNVVVQNKKVPLTSIEELLQLSPGPASGPDAIENVRPYALPGTKARLQFATSLPAFVYGALPKGVDPCSDVAKFYMRCLDKLGTNLVIQDEANPGPWAAFTDPASVDRGAWQALSFMSSTWRAVTDPSVDFDYNVVPHMVGNLADLAFDGQTVITQRGLGGSAARAAGGAGRACNYIGTSRSFPEDPERFDIGGESQLVRPYTGPKSEFLAMVPWVTPDAPRPELQETARKLGPGSGDPLENDYVETAAVADLPFPPVAGRQSCAAGPAGPVAAPRIRLRVTPVRTRAGRRTRFSFTATAVVAGQRQAVDGGLIRFAGAKVRTDGRGRATLVRTLRRPGSYAASVTAAGLRAGSASVRATPAQRRRPSGGRSPRFTG